jgi:type IV pilus assembly protein PilC
MAITYKWSGKSPRGGIQSGEMIAEGRNEVISALRKQGIIPTVINEKKQASSSFFQERKKKVTDKDLMVFTRQFATMFTAGIPIVQALDILSKQLDNKVFRSVVAQVKNDIEIGSTLADSMKKHPRVFNDLYVNMVAAGEAGGVLDTVLIRLTGYRER